MGFALFSKRKSIDVVMAEHRAQVLAGEEKAVRRMLRAYRSAEIAIRKKLERILAILADAADQPDEELSTWLFQQARYSKILDEITVEIERFAGRAENITAVQQKNSAERGVRNAIQLIKIEIRGSGPFPTAFISLNKAAVEEMVGVFADGSPLRSLFGEMGKEAVSKGHDVMVSAIASGQGPRQAGGVLANEIEKLTRDRAVRIARNESLRVLTTAQKRTYEENADVVEASRIVETLDSRTCPMCWARHGQILKHGEPLHRHVTCRGTTAPVTAYSKKWATGPEEFALLDDDKQLEILGRARFDLYKKGKLDLNDLYVETSSTWGPGLKYRNLTQLPKRPDGSVPVPKIEDGVNSVLKKREAKGIISK